MITKKYICLSIIILLSLALASCGENLPKKDDPLDLAGKIFLTEKMACLSMTGETVEARSEIRFTEEGYMCVHEACSDMVNCAINPSIDGRTIHSGLEVFYISEDSMRIMDSKGEIYYLSNNIKR